ncbi:hypothetical protein J21TS3_04810 [Paenibacillus cookii]|uniref:Uncharacterized protein n=1 Tax=Paenibacillus cookii TaxID=157839 RepID=A0ABQ4LQY0_9BACL|nr:hypothetical protein J21TS3_04810 [Paenibacillus cookii]
MAPWVEDNPIFMHVMSDRAEEVRAAIDQCAEVGFEIDLVFRKLALTGRSPIFTNGAGEAACTLTCRIGIF